MAMEGYIQVTEDYYIKRTESHPTAYDVYQIKPSKSERHPNGRISDIAYGCSLPRALNIIAHAVSESEDIVSLSEMIEERYNEFIGKVQEIIDANK